MWPFQHRNPDLFGDATLLQTWRCPGTRERTPETLPEGVPLRRKGFDCGNEALP